MKPFFLSINSFIFFVLIMGIVVMVEGFVFILLEMRFMRSNSAKFIVTQRSLRSPCSGRRWPWSPSFSSGPRYSRRC